MLEFVYGDDLWDTDYYNYQKYRKSILEILDSYKNKDYKYIITQMLLFNYYNGSNGIIHLDLKPENYIKSSVIQTNVFDSRNSTFRTTDVAVFDISSHTNALSYENTGLSFSSFS